MAILTPDQLSEIRRQMAAEYATQDWTKVQINAGIQAIEDYWETTARAGASAAIDAATTLLGFTFTGAQKLKLGKFWLLSKFNRGG